MADEIWKIVNLVGTTAQFAQGGGRVGLAGHDTTLGTWKCQLDLEGNFAIYARRNAAQTFTGLQTFNDGVNIGNLTPSRMLSLDASKNIVSLDATASRTLIGALAASEKGSANGVAPLGSDSKIAATYLPSYVDDVIEVANFAALPGTGEASKIYVTLDTNLTYRWSGSAYVEISASLALGETSSTAYRGDRGKIAYDHSLRTDNPHGVTRAQLGINITEGQIVLGGASGALQSDAGLRYTQAGGITRLVDLGSNTLAATVAYRKNAAAGYQAMDIILEGGVNQWAYGRTVAGSTSWRLSDYSGAGTLIGHPIVVSAGVSGEILLDRPTCSTGPFSVGQDDASTDPIARFRSTARNQSLIFSEAGVDKVIVGTTTSNGVFRIASGGIDDFLSVLLSLGGEIVLGGNAATKRGVRTTGTFTATGAGKFLNLAGTGVRPPTIAADGTLGVTDAATFRGVIGALATVTGDTTSRTANTVYAAPNGSAGAATFRALVAADIPSLSSTYQPLDSDLTAIAALSTTTFGRSLLTKADAASVRTAIGAAETGSVIVSAKSYVGTPTSTPTIVMTPMSSAAGVGSSDGKADWEVRGVNMNSVAVTVRLTLSGTTFDQSFAVAAGNSFSVRLSQALVAGDAGYLCGGEIINNGVVTSLTSAASPGFGAAMNVYVSATGASGYIWMQSSCITTRST